MYGTQALLGVQPWDLTITKMKISEAQQQPSSVLLASAFAGERKGNTGLWIQQLYMRLLLKWLFLGQLIIRHLLQGLQKQHRILVCSAL